MHTRSLGLLLFAWTFALVYSSQDFEGSFELESSVPSDGCLGRARKTLSSWWTSPWSKLRTPKRHDDVFNGAELPQDMSEVRRPRFLRPLYTLAENLTRHFRRPEQQKESEESQPEVDTEAHQDDLEVVPAKKSWGQRLWGSVPSFRRYLSSLRREVREENREVRPFEEQTAVPKESCAKRAISTTKTALGAVVGATKTVLGAVGGTTKTLLGAVGSNASRMLGYVGCQLLDLRPEAIFPSDSPYSSDKDADTEEEIEETEKSKEEHDEELDKEILNSTGSLRAKVISTSDQESDSRSQERGAASTYESSPIGQEDGEQVVQEEASRDTNNSGFTKDSVPDGTLLAMNGI